MPKKLTTKQVKDLFSKYGLMVSFTQTINKRLECMMNKMKLMRT